MARGQFDAEGFYAALDSHRQARDMNWKQVASNAKVSASTLTRMARGKRPDVDSLAALANWSGLKTDDFIRKEDPTREAEPLAQITAYLRADPNLTPKSAAALKKIIEAAYEEFREK